MQSEAVSLVGQREGLVRGDVVRAVARVGEVGELLEARQEEHHRLVVPRAPKQVHGAVPACVPRGGYLGGASDRSRRGQGARQIYSEQHSAFEPHYVGSYSALIVVIVKQSTRGSE